MVRLAAGERRKKRVMNIDHRTAESLKKIIRQHLHVAGENNQLDVEFEKQRKLARLIIGFRGGSDWNHMIRQPVATCSDFEVGVVGDNGNEIAGVFAGFPAEREIMETMVKLRDEHRHTRPMRGGSDARLHTERLPLAGCHSMRWKKMPASMSRCWSAWRILPPRSKIHPATRATIPG